MATIKTKQDLQSAILHLEQRQLQEKQSMQKHYHHTYELLKPVNLLKNAITDITEASDLKKDMLKAAVALAIGYLAKKIIETYVIKSRSPLAQGIETIVQIIISGVVAKNGNLFKDIALFFFRTILKHRQKQLLLPQSEQ